MRTIALILGALALWFGTTGTVYTFYSQQTDGELYKVDGTLVGACAGAGASVDTSASTFYVGESYYGIYRVDQAFLMFRVTGIPEDETIIDAKIKLYVQSEGSFEYQAIWIYKINDYTPLDSGDWNPAIIATLDSNSQTEITAGQWTTFASQELIDNVEKNKTLYVWVDSDQMCVGTPPLNDQRVRFRSNNYAGFDYDPYLWIETSSPDRDVYGPWIFTTPNMNPLIRVIE